MSVAVTKNGKKENIFAQFWENRKLIWKLSKNDFRKRYAASYLGVVWGLIQPLVTVLLYYVVFDVIFPNQRSSGSEVPFVLFLTSGLVPWFYFNEALQNGTNALVEYNYLVKKIVFKVSMLPVIKIIAALFTHLFFLVVLLVLSCIHGYYPSVYTIQLVYYVFCLMVLSLGICYATCAICAFFRDLTQLITIILQVGMWATPIMWDVNAFSSHKTLLAILKLNPMMYIVQGYRGAIYEHTWFFRDISGTIYFWVVTAVLFLLGVLIFRKAKVHFADVL